MSTGCASDAFGYSLQGQHLRLLLLLPLPLLLRVCLLFVVVPHTEADLEETAELARQASADIMVRGSALRKPRMPTKSLRVCRGTAQLTLLWHDQDPPERQVNLNRAINADSRDVTKKSIQGTTTTTTNNNSRSTGSPGAGGSHLTWFAAPLPQKASFWASKSISGRGALHPPDLTESQRSERQRLTAVPIK